VLAWELLVRRIGHGSLDRFARLLAVLAGLTLVVAVIYMLSPAGQWVWAGYDRRAFTPGERLLTEGRVLWFYLGLILFPRLEALGLYHDDIPHSTGLLEPWTTLPALAGLACLVWLAWWLRRRAPLVSFGIAWFLIGHGLESTFLSLEIAHEHRNYVPLFGILLAGAWTLARALGTVGPRKTLCIALAIVALTYFPFVTALRAHQFGEEGRRTQIEAQHHRTSARAQHEAGRILAGQEDAALANSPTHAFARAQYEIAIQLDPNAKMSWLGLIHLNCKAGKPVERGWIEELARRLRETPFGPGDRNVLYSLKEMSIDGALCLDRPDIELLFDAARANPTVAAPIRAMLHSWLADYLWLRARDLPAAQAELDRALTIAPYNPSNRLKRAQLAFLQRRYEEATKLLDGLRDAFLSRSEMETLAELKACLAASDPSARCIGK
jgi:tetratricopeptide (TPR) repeat protein